MDNKLKWEDKYSVGVKLIDDQHKTMFETINQLIDLMSATPKKLELDKVITRLIDYKRFHFSTEEKYFDEFNYEDKEKHVAEHKSFNSRLEEIVNKHRDDTVALAFALVDFLEDWLIDHLMVMDQKYVTCFREHGLK